MKGDATQQILTEASRLLRSLPVHKIGCIVVAGGTYVEMVDRKDLPALLAPDLDTMIGRQVN